VHKVHDTVLIPACNLSHPTVLSIHNEIDQRYPNRVLMDVGLVIARYGDNLDHVSFGFCVAGQAGAHHHCSFRLIVFRPFVEEVCIGRVLRSTSQGLVVTLGFFEDIFIPSHWMLKPSLFEESTGLWVWTPDEEEAEDEEEGGEEKSENKSEKEEEQKTEGENKEDEDEAEAGGAENAETETKEGGGEAEAEDKQFFKMEIGAEIRFKVKSIHFARITNSAKGRQAELSTTDKPWARGSSDKPNVSAAAAQSAEKSGGGGKEGVAPPHVRKRSSSVGLDDDMEMPPTMSIVASICEDGLGLTRWWEGGEDEEEEGEGEEDGEADQEEGEGEKEE